MIKGSCLCQACRYEAGLKLFDVLHCHCSICRKLHGSAFATYGGVSKDQFGWLGDSSKTVKYQSSKDIARFSCAQCGSMLVSIDESEPNTVYLSVGCIDSDVSIKPEYHQFVASKAPWYDITDDLPQYREGYSD